MKIKYELYKLLRVLVILAMSLSTAIAKDSNFIMDTQPERQFFMSTFQDCLECSTLTVIVSSEKISDENKNMFKHISEEWGEKHAGVVLSREELFANHRVFDGYGCERLDIHKNDFVIYADRNEQYCVVFPFKSKTKLESIIEIIESNLDDAFSIGSERGVNLIIDIYDKITKNDPFYIENRPLVVDFVRYLMRHGREYFKHSG